MSEHRALVTGAGHRIGRAISVALAKRGFDVAIHFASSSAGAEETAAMVRAEGQRAEILKANLVDMTEAEALLPQAVEALGGPLTLLVNNASIFEYDTLETATQASWDRHINSNLRAPVFLTQAFARQAPTGARDDRGEPVARGLVINMVDQRVRKLTPEFMTYTLAKAGLWTFTQTAARALAPDIRVNAIGPGPTLIGGRQSEEHFAQQRAATVLERGSNAEDITSAVMYFLDAPAVTGQLLCTDGGQHLAWQTPDVVGVE